MAKHDRSILEAALIGFQRKLAEVENKILEIRHRIRAATPVPTILPSLAAPRKRRKRRPMSATAKKRIGDATRKRWAEYRKKHKKTKS